jgi:hypothetical protein
MLALTGFFFSDSFQSRHSDGNTLKEICMKQLFTLLAVCTLVAGLAMPVHADDPIGFAVYTKPGFQSIVIPIYDGDANAAGWAHYSGSGYDAWVSVWGGDWADVPAKATGHYYCVIDEGPGCRSRWDCGSDSTGTCSLEAPNCHASSTCA